MNDFLHIYGFLHKTTIWLQKAKPIYVVSLYSLHFFWEKIPFCFGQKSVKIIVCWEKNWIVESVKPWFRYCVIHIRYIFSWKVNMLLSFNMKCQGLYYISGGYRMQGKWIQIIFKDNNNIYYHTFENKI